MRVMPSRQPNSSFLYVRESKNGKNRNSASSRGFAEEVKDTATAKALSFPARSPIPSGIGNLPAFPIQSSGYPRSFFHSIGFVNLVLSSSL